MYGPCVGRVSCLTWGDVRPADGPVQLMLSDMSYDMPRCMHDIGDGLLDIGGDDLDFECEDGLRKLTDCSMQV